MDKLIAIFQANPTLWGSVMSAVVFPAGKAIAWLQGRGEHSHKVKAAKLQWLYESLKAPSPISSDALYRELVFSLAFGFAYTNDEIKFALRQRNPSQTLRDIRYARPHAQLTANHAGYEQKPSNNRIAASVSLKARERIVDVFSVVCIVGIIVSAGLILVEPVGATMLLIEMCFGLWMALDGVRSLAAAQRLISCARPQPAELSIVEHASAS
jgi:hypothetical protein